MYLKLGELRGRRKDVGLPYTMVDISEGTGIGLRTLENLVANDVKQIRLEYIDALCVYFDCTPNDLIGTEPVRLPLELNLRPDRHGKKVGEF